MQEKKLEKFKQLLMDRLQELLGEAGRAADDLSKTGATGFADPMDQAADELDRNRMLRLRDREAKLISKIEGAMRRIEEGSYGVCELCGEEIDEKRLVARPIATQCIECKTEQELEEARNRFGGGPSS